MSRGAPVVVLGAGLEGLVAAASLARAGLPVVVLEEGERAGGALRSDEFQAGYRGAGLPLSLGPFRSAASEALGNVEAQWLEADPRLTALTPAGPALSLRCDPTATAEELRPHVGSDAERLVAIEDRLARLARHAARIIDAPPPDLLVTDIRRLLPYAAQALGLARLGRRAGRDLVRWAPMPVADLASEWFQNERLQAAVAARALLGSSAGPMSPGTTAPLLLRVAVDGGGLAGPTRFVKGGPGRLCDALASMLTRQGVRIRTEARPSSIATKDGRVRAVVLQGGEEVAARAVVSSLDIRRTALELLAPDLLDPEQRGRLRSHRCEGRVARVDLALDGLPNFSGVTDSSQLRGRLLIGDSLEVLERAADAAMHGELPDAPWLEATIPTLLDPGLAPAGKHVLSAWVQCVPYRLADGNWEARRAELGDIVLKRLEDHAPGLTHRVLHRRVMAPPDVEATWRLAGGHPWQGELSLNQLFAVRPLLGWARYRTPIPGLYLCGTGTHPGIGSTGASGANAARVVLDDLR